MKGFLKKYWKWVLAAGITSLLPILVNIGLSWKLPTASGLENSHWLGFWGSYLGALIAGIPAFLALHHSQQQAKQQHEEFCETQRLTVMPTFSTDYTVNPIIDPDNIPSTCITIHENHIINRLSVIDVQDVKDYLLDASKSHKPLKIHLENIGAGPAMGVRLIFPEIEECLSVGNIGSHSSENILIAFQNGKSCPINISFSDILGNTYTQTGGMHYFPKGDKYAFLVLSTPKLKAPLDTI